MDSLIETFHIDIRLLLAQVINFGIVFFVLYFFALKPLIKVMSDRTKKIEKSIDDAKKIEEKLIVTEEDYKNIIAKAKKEANDILEKASVQANKKEKEMIIKAKEDIGEIIEQEKAKMQVEKAKTLKDIKKEVSDLVIVAVSKILEKKIDNKKGKELIENIIK